MKFLFYFLSFFSLNTYAQSALTENVVIITTDGFRWQELFNGADSAIINNTRFVKDTALAKTLFWHEDLVERRKRLMPFTWNYIARKGQIWGNRKYENNVNVSNPYRISYAGYNELLSGFPDPSIITNKPKRNRNDNLLNFLGREPEYQGKVAAFASWNIFSFILKGGGNNFYLDTGPKDSLQVEQNEQAIALNQLQQQAGFAGRSTRSDLITFTLATEYMKSQHPKVLFIGFGETDEFAHDGEYDNYLNQAVLFDKFISDIWSLIQRDGFYRNKTTVIITTDHGRGNKQNKWTSHGVFTKGSEEIWLMQIGPNILPLGEIKSQALVYQEQIAQTIAAYLGVNFKTSHPIEQKSVLLAGIQ